MLIWLVTLQKCSHKKKLLATLILGVFFSQNLNAVCVKIDCTDAVQSAVEEVVQFVTEATQGTQEAVEKFLEEHESLDELYEEHAKAQEEKIASKKQLHKDMKLFEEELRKTVFLKEQLLKIRTSRKIEEDLGKENTND